jgi:hypothetical protein
MNVAPEPPSNPYRLLGGLHNLCAILGMDPFCDGRHALGMSLFIVASLLADGPKSWVCASAYVTYSSRAYE